MLHKIIAVIDRKTGLTSESGKRRIGREVHVGELSLLHPAMLYHSKGVTVTSPVDSYSNSINGDIEIFTENTIYKLELVEDLLKK